MGAGSGVRPFILNVLDKMSNEKIGEALKSPESWERAMEKAGMSPDAPGADYERMKRLHGSKAYTLSAPTNWYADLHSRRPMASYPRQESASGEPCFGTIGSDNPAVLEGREQMVGFENADTVTSALSRRVLFYGTLQRIRDGGRIESTSPP
jgi:hypothetical protein